MICRYAGRVFISSFPVRPAFVTRGGHRKVTPSFFSSSVSSDVFRLLFDEVFNEVVDISSEESSFSVFPFSSYVSVFDNYHNDEYQYCYCYRS